MSSEWYNLTAYLHFHVCACHLQLLCERVCAIMIYQQIGLFLVSQQELANWPSYHYNMYSVCIYMCVWVQYLFIYLHTDL